MLPLGEGWDLLDGLVADAERHRLRLEAWWADHPPQGAVVRPLIIAGAYRTGTTFLHRAMAQAQPHRRTLLGWEATIPTPPPSSGLQSRLKDPRCAEQQVVTDLVFDADPGLRDLHYEPADLPAECVQALAQTGVTGLWPAVAPCPDYVGYLLSVDATEAYAYYDRCLRTLDPDARWLLKSPMHSLYLDTILDIWPDAVVVAIDRDEEETVRSAVRLFSHLRNVSRPGEAHEEEVAGWVRPYLREHVARCDRPDVLHVDASTLRRDPQAVVAYLTEIEESACV